MMRERRVMRRMAVVFAACVMAATWSAMPASAEDETETSWPKKVVNGEVQAPETPNPYIANMPSANDADYAAWTTYGRHSRDRMQAMRHHPRSRIRDVTERERNNDSRRRAQRVRINTNNRDGVAGVNIAGRGPASGSEGVTTDSGFVDELAGSITDAKVLPVLGLGDSVTGSGVIGDEVDDPFDFDFLALPDLVGGSLLSVDIDTPIPLGDLDSIVVLYASDGTLIADNDDGAPDSFDSLLNVTVPADGTYYVSIAGFGAFEPLDPFDSASESITGDPGSQGEYSFSITSAEVDVDYYKFRLDAGDVFGATVSGGLSLEMYSRDGTLLIGSAQDATFIHPESSPLPGGGNASLSYVVPQRGNYYLAVTTGGDYNAQLRGFRPLGDSQNRKTQILFLDFDGASVDPGIYFGGPFGFEVPLSPLSSFLPRWGLAPDDENAVIGGVIASVEENLDSDIEQMGLNRRFDIELRNSRDHADPWGQPNVSRIIVGGTQEELGIPTIGIAESIDVGNFNTEETAVVLLDLLSGSPGNEPFVPSASLNNYPLEPGTSIIDLIGVGVGNITAHEAGHFFAAWHTDQFNPAAQLMDQGGNLPGTLGIGVDGVFGSGDDVDVDFGTDTYVPSEGFTGSEDTLNAISFGLWAHRGGHGHGGGHRR